MALVSLPNMWVLTPRLVMFTRAVRFKLSGGDTPPLRGEATRLRGSQPCTPSHRSGAAESGFAPRACLRLWSLACCSQLPLSPGPGHLLLPCLWEFPSSASQSVTLCKLLVDGRGAGILEESRGSQGRDKGFPGHMSAHGLQPCIHVPHSCRAFGAASRNKLDTQEVGGHESFSVR